MELQESDESYSRIFSDYRSHKQITSEEDFCDRCSLSAFYSKAERIGSDLIDFAKMFSEEMGAYDLVLEVANEYSGVAIESESESEESDEEESDEEESEEESDSEDSWDEMDLEEEDVWYPDEGVMDTITEEFWKKCMRLDHRGNPVDNLDREYLSDLLDQYFNCEKHSTMRKSPVWN